MCIIGCASLLQSAARLIIEKGLTPADVSGTNDCGLMYTYFVVPVKVHADSISSFHCFLDASIHVS